MSQNLARYHARSPRYILNAEDSALIRVAGPTQEPWDEGTQIKNVSLTGLAFLAPTDLCPKLGEVIKIQFLAPGGKMMATHALVTRVEPESPHSNLVGVHFYKIEMSHRLMLAQSISQKIKNNPLHEDAIDLKAEAKLLRMKKILIMFICLLGWLGFVLFLFK